MKLAKISTGLSKMAGRSGLMLKKYSPEILLILGITGGIGATYLACKATLKVDDVMAVHNNKLDNISECWEKVLDGEISTEVYNENEHKKDLAIAYTQTALAFAKLYGPAVTLGIASIGCVVGGHGIMKKRNVALIAAYKAVEEGFSSYRKRVVEEHGEETDYMYKNGLRAEEVVETEVGEDGKARKVKKTKLSSPDTNGLSMYAKFFDESSNQWDKKSNDYNFMYLRQQQNWANDLLKARGHLFLNEVYDLLGIQRTGAGAVVGWVIGDGDNFVDFGIFDGNSAKARDFVNGYEKSILLDFNVDGVITDLI